MMIPKIFIIMFLYSITASMFFPIIQSFLYAKVCIRSKGEEECSRPGAARDQDVHTQTNLIMLLGSVVLCISGLLSSSYIGRVGDNRSRRIALLIPFTGLLLADIVLLALTYFKEASPYLFVLSELFFGCFGGYMALFSSAFSYVSSQPRCDDPAKRGTDIAWLEGTLGMGAFVGLIGSSQLANFSYFQAVCFFSAIHIICIIMSCYLEDLRTSTKSLPMSEVDAVDLEKRTDASKKSLLLLTAFGTSFFSMIGTAHILFFYLKQRFLWDTEYYSYYRASVQATSTTMALLVYPWLKRKGVKDANLAVFGLLMRIIAKAWMAIAWSPTAVFGAVPFEMFGRFPATALRSLIASNAGQGKQGAAFAKVGSLEAGCNLAAAIVFHSVFPWSIAFLPQLSFIFMSTLMIPPAIAVWFWRARLDR